jgi:hypothetical protein
MISTLSKTGSEKDQVTRSQVSADSATDMVLPPGYAGKGNTMLSKHPPNKSGAIKTGSGTLPSPYIFLSKLRTGGLDNPFCL